MLTFNRSTVPAVCLVFALAPAGVAAAQHATIVGKAIDCAAGTALPHVTINVRPRASKLDERHLESDGAGRFSVLGLASGRYNVTIHGTSLGSHYFGSHVVTLEPGDLQHIVFGASTDASHPCRPYAIPREPSTVDQTTIH